jgi:hypothetical protein
MTVHSCACLRPNGLQGREADTGAPEPGAAQPRPYRGGRPSGPSALLPGYQPAGSGTVMDQTTIKTPNLKCRL